MSYGYEPPKHDPGGTWGEAFLITKIVFQVLAGPLALLLGTLALLVLTLMALFSYPPLALIPVGIIGVGVGFIVRRDRRMQAEALADLERRPRK